MRFFARGWLRSALAALTLTASLCLSVGGLSTRVAHADAVYAPSETTLAIESQVLDLVNADRAANGLELLQFDPSLATIARWRSEDMASRGYFSHDIGNVAGYQVFQVLREQGISYRVAGENLAYNYYGVEETASRAEGALMNSPAHRANILRPDYTHLGVGVAMSADGRVLFTQIFKKEW